MVIIKKIGGSKLFKAVMPIIEVNSSDPFWGWGHDKKGENVLGTIWMRLREDVVRSATVR